MSNLSDILTSDQTLNTLRKVSRELRAAGNVEESERIAAKVHDLITQNLETRAGGQAAKRGLFSMVSPFKRKKLLGFRAMLSALIEARASGNKRHVLQCWGGNLEISRRRTQNRIAVADSYFSQHQQSQAWAFWRATWRATTIYQRMQEASLVRQTKAGIHSAWESISSIWTEDPVTDTNALGISYTSCRLNTFSGGPDNVVLVENIESEMEISSTTLQWQHCDYAEGIHLRESTIVQFGTIAVKDIVAVVQTEPLNFVVHACPSKPDSEDRSLLEQHFTAAHTSRSAEDWVSVIYAAANLEEQLRPPILICISCGCHAALPVQQLCAFLAAAGIEYSIHQFKFGAGGEAVAGYFHEVPLYTLRGGIVCASNTDNFVNQVMSGLLSRPDRHTALCIPIALLPVNYNGKLAHSLGVNDSLEAIMAIMKGKPSRIDIVSVMQHSALCYCVAASFSWQLDGMSDNWYSPDRLRSFQLLNPSLLQGGNARIALQLSPEQAGTTELVDDEPRREIPLASHPWVPGRMENQGQTVHFEGTGLDIDLLYAGSNCVHVKGPSMNAPFGRLAGEYRRSPELFGKRPAYLRTDHMALWFAEDTQSWWIGNEAHIGKSLGLMRIDSSVLLAEEIAGVWSVWDGGNRLWTRLPGVEIDVSSDYTNCDISVQLWPSDKTSNDPANAVISGSFCIVGGANKACTMPMSSLTDGCLDVVLVPANSSRIDLATSYRALQLGKTVVHPPVQYRKTTRIQIVPFSEQGCFHIDSQIYPGSPVEMACYKQAASFVTSLALTTSMAYQEANGAFHQWLSWTDNTRRSILAANAAWVFSCQSVQRNCAGDWRKTVAYRRCRRQSIAEAVQHHISRQQVKRRHKQQLAFRSWTKLHQRCYDRRCALSMALRSRRASAWQALTTTIATRTKNRTKFRSVHLMQAAVLRIWASMTWKHHCALSHRHVQWWMFNASIHKEFRVLFSAPKSCSVQQYIIACCDNPSQVQNWSTKGHVGNFTVCWPVGLGIYSEASDNPANLVDHLDAGTTIAIQSVMHYKEACLMGQLAEGWVALSTKTGMPCVNIRSAPLRVEEEAR